MIAKFILNNCPIVNFEVYGKQIIQLKTTYANCKSILQIVNYANCKSYLQVINQFVNCRFVSYGL